MMSKKALKHTIPPETLNKAKKKVYKSLERNLHFRCNKIIASLNKTTKSNPKFCGLLKQFELNKNMNEQILKNICVEFEEWSGGKYVKELTDDDECFKKIRAHWNRHKPQQLGNELFCTVLGNLFKIAVETTELSEKEKVIFYIDLFRDLGKETIQFERSMSRPVIPIACFAKANQFKKFCKNILESFVGDNVKWNDIKSLRYVRDVNSGVSKTTYIKNAQRAQKLADSYYTCLEDIKLLISNASNNFIHHSIQMHLNWINQTFDDMVTLIKWSPITQIIASESFNQRPLHSPHSQLNITENTTSIVEEETKIQSAEEYYNYVETFADSEYGGDPSENACARAYPEHCNCHCYTQQNNQRHMPFIQNGQHIPMPTFTNHSPEIGNNFNPPNMEPNYQLYQAQIPQSHVPYYPITTQNINHNNNNFNNNIYPYPVTHEFPPTHANNIYQHNIHPQNIFTQRHQQTPYRQFQSVNNFTNQSNRVHMMTRNVRNVRTQPREPVEPVESHINAMRQSMFQLQ